jgi:hypothetical protein
MLEIARDGDHAEAMALRVEVLGRDLPAPE